MRLFFVVFCSIAALACAAEPHPADGNAAAAEEVPSGPAAARDTGLIRGTPPGGLTDWVGEIEAGIGGIAERAETDRDAARKAALDLYVGRQEYLELYYGSAGRLSGNAPALGEAVMAAEARFHDLMQLLNAAQPDPSALAMAEGALLERYQAVRSEAERSDVPLVPPGNVAVAPGGAS